MILVFFLAYLIIFLYLCTMFLKKQIIAIVSMKAMVVICIALCACTPRSLREAQEVVAQADSLWHEGKMYGVDEGDSTTLAQAYERLKELSAVSRQLSDVSYQLSEVCPFVHRTSLLCTYAHACYHYGRLLREKDNPVEAMQVFIEATHSRTRDYHILGRVYSNMGDICHLAGNFPLSYNMYERSADMYLQNGDTLLYYYDLNNMAFEKGMSKELDNCCSIVHLIEKSEYCNRHLAASCNRTLAEAFLIAHRYDSALYFAYEALHNNQQQEQEPASQLILAQAYSYVGQYDSAVNYALQVIKHSQALGDINNALYILTNNDETKDKNAIRRTAADRSDTQKLLEIRQGKLSQAVQLLEQDLNKKPDWKWLLAIIGTLLVIGGIVGFYIYQKRKKHALLTQQIEGLNIQNAEAQEQLANLTKEIGALSQLHDAHHKEIVLGVEKFCAMIRSKQDLQEYLHWRNFTEMCQLSDKYLYNLVTRLEPYNLSPKEIRLCVLVVLKAETNQMVDMIPYAPSGLGKFKYTTANKLGTTTPNLRTFLLCLLG